MGTRAPAGQRLGVSLDGAAADRFLRGLFQVAVAAAMPGERLAGFLPDPPKGRVVVVGAGKASAAMAAALEAHWPGPLSGLVVTRYGHAVPCGQIEIVEAAHPVPDAAGQAASRRILELARGLGPDDLLIALISGGGSALLALPAAGVSLADKQAVNRHLLTAAAPIDHMNTLRKHLSAIKGGRLAVAAFPAACVSLLISDVPGDDPAVIASGPTVADPSSLADARALLARYPGQIPPAVREALDNPANETPKPGDIRLSKSHVRMIATPMQSLKAAAGAARAAGVVPVILGDALEGEARALGRSMAAEALKTRAAMVVGAAPVVMLSGGETTVTMTGTPTGRGGRNVEFLMGLAAALDGAASIYALAGDTDGIDGADEVAGAVVTPDTVARAARGGYRLHDAMAAHDGHGFFHRLGDQVVTGPTLTNVNDFRAILILPPSPLAP